MIHLGMVFYEESPYRVLLHRLCNKVDLMPKICVRRERDRGGGGEPCFQGVPIKQISGLNTLDSETFESLGNGEISNKLFA